MMLDKNNFHGFKIIKCHPRDSVVTHDLFIKEHSVRNQSEDKPANRTLFIANVPPWMTKEKLIGQFSTMVGPVESVILQRTLREGDPLPSDNGFQFAFLVFKKSASLQKALSFENKVFNFKIARERQLHIKSWLCEYNKSVIEQKMLQQKVKEVIDEYDKKEVEKAKLKESTDNEGWTVVSKKGRNRGGSRTESNETKVNARLKKKDRGLKNFYTFQIKESKMNEIAALRKKHEEDKKKLDAIKKSRKFKPY